MPTSRTFLSAMSASGIRSLCKCLSSGLLATAAPDLQPTFDLLRRTADSGRNRPPSQYVSWSRKGRCPSPPHSAAASPRDTGPQNGNLWAVRRRRRFSFSSR